MNKDDIKKITGTKHFEEWYTIVEKIIINPEFKKRLYFPHHGNNNVFTHCIKVSYDAYIFSINKKIDSRKCALAGLLHDFYPYLWRNSKYHNFLDQHYYEKLKTKKPFLKKHGFTHGEEAANNYIKYFPELKDKMITDAIKTHMFPLTPPPKNKIGWVITLFDKTNAIKEMPVWNTVKTYLYLIIYLQLIP